MQLNFLQYFQLEAAAKKNISYLLCLDLLVANENICRQEWQQSEPSRMQKLEFETAVETAYRKQKSGKRNQVST